MIKCPKCDRKVNPNDFIEIIGMGPGLQGYRCPQCQEYVALSPPEISKIKNMQEDIDMHDCMICSVHGKVRDIFVVGNTPYCEYCVNELLQEYLDPLDD